MRFFEGLLTARSHIAFFVGLSLALGLVYEVESRTPPEVKTGVEDFSSVLGVEGKESTPLSPTNVALDASELEAAHVAWVVVRDVSTCESAGEGVCAKCFGLDPDDATWLADGDAIGTRAATAIARELRRFEPRWFHIC